jgi:hypothetical protein
MTPSGTRSSPVTAASHRSRRAQAASSATDSTAADNRQLKAAFYRIAITQACVHPVARAYLERKQAGGKSRREAIRCLKRQLARVVFNTLKTSPALTKEQGWPRRVTSPPISSRVRCRLEAAATNVAAPPRPTSSAQGRKDPRTRPPGRPQFQARPPWCRTRSRRSPDRSGRHPSLHRLRRGCTAERRPRSLPVLHRIALGYRRRFRFDAGRRDSGRSRLEPAPLRR